MKRRPVGGLLRSESANVAATVALSLFGLLAAGGLAFDYARLASLDTELQHAADQAALAAASQLDKKEGACERAVAAAQTLVSNQTLFGNDGGGLAVTVTPPATLCGSDTSIAYDASWTIKLYQDKAKTEPATDDTNARFVEVTVDARTGEYALTPLVAAFDTGLRRGTAYAGMGSAICKVPPLMVCNPNPGQPFNSSVGPEAGGWRGVGLQLFQGGGGNAWAPGAFGYLDVGAFNSGSPDQRIALGMDNPNTNCVADADVDVDTGVSATVLDAINVRMDVFQNGWPRNTCYPDAGCNPAANTTKDIVKVTGSGSAPGQCGHNPNNANGWTNPPVADQYIAQNEAGDDPQVTLMGYPMDICHYPLGGTCREDGSNERFGNAEWRRDIYFRTNHGTLTGGGTNWIAATGLPANATRYEVYQWEQGVGGSWLANGTRPTVSSGGYTQHGLPVCKPPGLAPGGNQPDRRIVAVAIADNCDELSGGSVNVDVGAWVEVFLVQPSVARSAEVAVSATDIYVEIAGPANPTNSGAVAQVVTRDIPYLIE